MLCAYQPTTRPVALSVELAADDGTKRRDRTKKTWQDIMNEDLKEIGLDWTGLDWKGAKSVAGNRTKWRTVVAQFSRGNSRN